MATCPRCGGENTRGGRFCSACGNELVAAPARALRKTVTVLFADVTGSTALGEQLDPEAFRRVIARYFDAARSSIERHGGTVEKFIGDAVMAVFGVPTVHEDDALRALRAAADLRESLTALNVELERDYAVSLQLRTGVNTGEVVTGTEERLVTGDAVNVAARLEQAAQPDEILLGEPTLWLARGAVDVEPVDPLSLKGKSEPLPAYRLLRVVEGAPAFERRLDAPLVGRSEELAKLRTAFEAAVSERRCRLVTVLGPPGIGKSRLAQEAAAALAADAVVLSGRCLPYGEGITYWPLREIFAAASAEPELDEALSAAGAEEVSWAIRKALERRARERPLALVIEDIHWAEPTLLDLIEHLVDWTRDAQLLILCLARPELLDERPGWGGRPNAESFTLDPLLEEEADALIEGLLGDSPLAENARARIRTVAEGNPLFVEQLVVAVAEGGDPERTPSTIEALLSARLDTLPDEELELLANAAVVGLEFEWEALAQIGQDGRRPAGSLLFALVQKELIRPHEAIPDRFRFRHILIRNAAYNRLAKETRANLHERFADWLGGQDEEFEEILGYHLEQAYRSLVALGPATERARNLAERAAEHLAASGARANARGDMQASASLLGRAAELLPMDDRRRLQLLPALGRVLREAGELERADGVLEEAIQRARAADEPAIAADAAVVLTDLRFHRTAETGVLREDVLRAIDEALPIFARLGDDAGRARALTIRGKLRFWAGELGAALEDLEQAARVARRVRDRAAETESLRYIPTTMREGPIPVAQALVGIADLRAHVETNRRLELSLLTTQAKLEAMRGRFDAARELISRVKAAAEDASLDLARISQISGEVELLAGDSVAAEREFRFACETFERIGELGYLSSVAPLLAGALYEQRRHDEALELTDQWPADRLTAPEDADGQASWRCVRAKLLARKGQLDEAERLAREAVMIAARTDFLDLQARTVAALGEVLRLAGRSEEAADAVADAIRLYEQKGNVVAAKKLRGVPADRAGVTGG